jgi:riboflavin biosynthesis pyrimidine reductase
VRLLLRAVLPDAGEAHDLATDDGRAWVEAVYAPPPGPHVRLNMITTLTGSAVGADGTSETLSNRVDRTVLGVIRAASDAVLVGAQTVRAEGYVVPRRTNLAIVTATGDLSGHDLDAGTDRVWLVCPASRAEDVHRRAGMPRAHVVAVDDEHLAPRSILDALAGRGLTRIVCEGGPTLAGAFAGAGVIDEYCITLAPVLEPARSPFLVPAGHSRPDTDVTGMLVDEAAFSYLRLRPRQPGRVGGATA